MRLVCNRRDIIKGNVSLIDVNVLFLLLLNGDFMVLGIREEGALPPSHHSSGLISETQNPMLSPGV